MHVADQVSQLRTGSSASDQVFLSGRFADDLLAYFVTDAQGFELGSHPRHVVRAVGHNESFAGICSKLDNLPSQARPSSCRTPALCVGNELHVVFLNLLFQEGRMHCSKQVLNQDAPV